METHTGDHSKGKASMSPRSAVMDIAGATQAEWERNLKDYDQASHHSSEILLSEFGKRFSRMWGVPHGAKRH